MLDIRFVHVCIFFGKDHIINVQKPNLSLRNQDQDQASVRLSIDKDTQVV